MERMVLVALECPENLEAPVMMVMMVKMDLQDPPDIQDPLDQEENLENLENLANPANLALPLLPLVMDPPPLKLKLDTKHKCVWMPERVLISS
jgi:hypothetical protein